MLKRFDPFALLALVAVPGAVGTVFFYAPLERTMGAVQKIFYFHLALAAAAFLSFFVACVAGVLYLLRRQRVRDEQGAAAAEIGVLFTSLVLLTGSTWGRPIWNSWWTWDPRLTTSLILWFIFTASLILRGAVEQEEKRAVFCAVMAIVGFIDVPVVFLSARMWRSIHPTVIRSEGIALDLSMIVTLAVSLTAMLILWAALFRMRCSLHRQENTLLDLQQRSQR